MRQANTAWKQQKHMSKTIYGQICMSQNEVSFFDPKMVTLKGKKVTSFSDISKQEKNMCCNNGNGLFLGAPSQHRMNNQKQENMKPTNAKTTAQSNKSKNLKTIVQNLICQLHRF